MTSPIKPTQRYLNQLILTGTLLSMLWVLMGGAWYLHLHGDAPLSIAQFNTYTPISLFATLHQLHQSPDIGFINAGILLLIFTQMLRLAWLLVIYLHAGDRWFSFFTSFILCAIIYSFAFMS